jgi:hypothetical protein
MNVSTEWLYPRTPPIRTEVREHSLEQEQSQLPARLPVPNRIKAIRGAASLPPHFLTPVPSPNFRLICYGAFRTQVTEPPA